MSTKPDTGAAPAGEPQFDKAEFITQGVEPEAAVPCHLCKRPISGEYYEVGGKTVCSFCAGRVQAGLTGGSGFARFARAMFLGLLAAIVGAGAWYGIRALTGYEFGLVAVVVGVLVGFAVRKGSAGRGGLLYQFVALLLTYACVVATYVPATVRALMASKPPDATTSMPTPSLQDKGDDRSASVPPDHPLNPQQKALQLVLALVIAFTATFVLLVPGLVLSKEVIGLLIIAFALFEAWKINRPARVVLRGPYKLAVPPASAAPAASSPAPQAEAAEHDA